MHDAATIKSALERAVKVVTLRPERGQRVYRNVASVSGSTLCHVEESGRTLCLDVGKAVGGSDAGPNPSMLLRSAMSGCVAIGVKQWAARRDVPVDEVEVVLETGVDARGQLGVCEETPPGFLDVRMTIIIISPASVEEIEDLVSISLKYSPLVDVFLNPQPVEHRLTVIGSDGAARREDVT